MIRLSTFTPRMWLILAHDLLATAAAVVASFFIRFEEAGLAAALATGWSILLPAFVVYAGFVYFLFGLYKAKWRFTSLPDLCNIVRAATVLAVSLLVLDYMLVWRRNVYGTFFFGKITIVLYWLLQIAFLAGPRIAYRYFRYTRTRSTPSAARFDADAGRSGAPPMPKCCCARSRAARSRRSGRSASCRRRWPIAARRSAAFPCSAISTTSSSVVADLRRARHQRYAADASRRARSCRKRSRKRS